MNLNKTNKKHSPPRAGVKAARAVTASKVRVVQYACDPLCKATKKKRTVNPGDIVLLIPDDTDVTLVFATSPFVSGATHISIPANTVHTEIIAAVPLGSYPYKLTCSGCGSPTTDPEMIVE